MKRRPLDNAAASVRGLLDEARAFRRPFNELLQYFAMERVLFRVSRSPHAENVVLKGALMLAMWKVSLTRPTKDVDLLGQMENDSARPVRAGPGARRTCFRPSAAFRSQIHTRRHDRDAFQPLSEIAPEVSAIPGDEMRGLSRDGGPENRLILRGELQLTRNRNVAFRHHVHGAPELLEAISLRVGIEVPASFLECVSGRHELDVLQLPEAAKAGVCPVGGGKKNVRVEEEPVHETA